MRIIVNITCVVSACFCQFFDLPAEKGRYIEKHYGSSWIFLKSPWESGGGLCNMLGLIQLITSLVDYPFYVVVGR
jgi:hypothetical protein